MYKKILMTGLFFLSVSSYAAQCPSLDDWAAHKPNEDWQLKESAKNQGWRITTVNDVNLKDERIPVLYIDVEIRSYGWIGKIFNGFNSYNEYCRYYYSDHTLLAELNNIQKDVSVKSLSSTFIYLNEGSINSTYDRYMCKVNDPTAPGSCRWDWTN